MIVLGFSTPSEVHVKNRLLEATFFNLDQSIAEEHNYIWNDSIEDLCWTIFHKLEFEMNWFT